MVVPGSVSDIGLTLVSRGIGTTTVTLQLGSARHDIVVTVAQVADTLEASLADTGILRLNLGGRVPLICRAVDRNGHPLAIPPLVTPGNRGTVIPAACPDVVAERSGYDTLTVTSGSLSVRVPIILVLSPQVSSPIGEIMAVDSTPVGTGFWAPSMRRNSRGELELYYAGYTEYPDSTGYTRGNLYRLISTDGMQFQFDGIALAHDPDIVALDGRGIENVTVVSRNDGPGGGCFTRGAATRLTAGRCSPRSPAMRRTGLRNQVSGSPTAARFRRRHRCMHGGLSAKV
jgi:hypothetical protein